MHTTVEDAASLLGTAVGAAHHVSEQVLEAFRRGVEIHEKASFQDLVTTTDREVEERIAAYITARHDDACIVGEEHGVAGGGPVRWYVDPIDGTTNFASGLPFFSVSIGAYVDGSGVAGVVHDPFREETFAAGLDGATLNGRPLRTSGARSAVEAVLATAYPYNAHTDDSLRRYGTLLERFRAVRRLGSTALHLAYVAAGRVDVSFETRVGAWDIAAGLHLVRQAGGCTWAASRAPDVRDQPGAWRHLASGRAFEPAGSPIAEIVPELLAAGQGFGAASGG
jgi:myo-inositol-1(or 4)-monophosphatase